MLDCGRHQRRAKLGHCAGFFGADAITAYIWDAGDNNAVAGHRRWILYPQTQVMGTGDVPNQDPYSEANATWVFDSHYGGPRPSTRTPYVAWPPAGYAPYQLVYPRWSFAYPNANFVNATVTMKSNGVAIAAAKETYATGFGENTVVWVPMGLDANSYSTVFPFGGTDTVYTVAISNIVGAPQSSYTYTVTVFDPAVAGADYFPPVISGPSQPIVGVSNAYTFTAISNATSYQWRSMLRAPYSLFDGAESGLGNFTVNTSAGYAVQDSSVVASGSYSFHLAHPSPTNQILQLNRLLFPSNNTQVIFKSRLGYATSFQIAMVQVSTTDGAIWQDVYSQPGSGGSGEASFTTRSFTLSDYAGKPMRLRFNYHCGPYDSHYYQTNPGVGWYLDDVIVTNTQQLINVASNSITLTNFTFTPAQATNYCLQARVLVFTEFPLDWGPVNQVTAVVGTPVIVLSSPVLTNNQVRIDFTLQSGVATTFKLLQADQVTGTWTTNATAVLTTNVPGVSYRYTTTPGGAARFYRVKTP